MAANILFSHSYFLRYDPKQWATSQPYPPLGTLQAAAVMQQQGYAVSFFDTMFSQKPDEILPALATYMPRFFVLYDDGFNYLTKMCLTNMRQAAFEMMALAKERGCTVIVSSSDSTDRFELYLEKGADFVLLGEAEITLTELCRAIESGQKDLLQIEGIAYTHEGAVIKTARRKVVQELDALPMTAWELLDITPYKKMWQQHHGYFSINMSTTRGCPFKCNWCAKPIYGNRYNSRSPQHVVNELKYLKQKFSFNHIWFADDIFGLKPGWVHEFALLMEQENIKTAFKIQSRADLLVQENYVNDLARAGCQTIWMGAESGSQKILDAMDKGTTVQQIYKAVSLIKQHGMRPAFFIQFGYLGETMNDIKLTINMIEELLPDELGISVSYPLPGTKFYDTVKEELVHKTNWTDSDELALMFRNTYKPAFYKQLHRYVHKDHRLHKGIWHFKKMDFFSLRSLKKIAGTIYLFPQTLLAKNKLNKLAGA